jgi:hypothetical protein
MLILFDLISDYVLFGSLILDMPDPGYLVFLFKLPRLLFELDVHFFQKLT